MGIIGSIIDRFKGGQDKPQVSQEAPRIRVPIDWKTGVFVTIFEEVYYRESGITACFIPVDANTAENFVHLTTWHKEERREELNEKIKNLFEDSQANNHPFFMYQNEERVLFIEMRNHGTFAFDLNEYAL